MYVSMKRKDKMRYNTLYNIQLRVKTITSGGIKGIKSNTKNGSIDIKYSSAFHPL